MKNHLTPDIYVFDFPSFLIRVSIAASLAVIVYSTFFVSLVAQSFRSASHPIGCCGLLSRIPEVPIMNDNNRREDPALAELGIWENEGGALGRHEATHSHGRHREPDKSWTLHHVFSGAPSELEAWFMAGPGETEARSTMIFLDVHNSRKTPASGLQQTFETRF